MVPVVMAAVGAARPRRVSVFSDQRPRISNQSVRALANGYSQNKCAQLSVAQDFRGPRNPEHSDRGVKRWWLATGVWPTTPSILT